MLVTAPAVFIRYVAVSCFTCHFSLRLHIVHADAHNAVVWPCLYYR